MGKRRKGADMVGFTMSDDDIQAAIEIAETLDRMAAELERRGMDPVRARTVGTFFKAVQNLEEQRKDNDQLRADIAKAEFNILTGMQKVVTAFDHFKLMVETLQELTAAVQKLTDLVGRNTLAEYNAARQELREKENTLIDMGYKKPNSK
jgi:hypothetical protein